MLTGQGETVQVAILEAPHASCILVIVEIVSIIHLLYRLNSLGQKAAHSAMFPLALLAEASSRGAALANDVPPLIALVANCPLRTPVAPVGRGEAVEAKIIVEAGVVMVSYLLASETPNVALEVSEKFNLLIGNLCIIVVGLHWSLLLVGVIHLHYQVRYLGSAGLLRAEETVCVDWS